MTVSLIFAVAKNGVIGKDNQLIWHLPEDLKFFKRVTLGHHIVMGRKTFDSIGKPLPKRTNVIITRNSDYRQEECVVVNSVKEAIDYARNNNETECFIIGGAEIFKVALPLADKIYLTEVHENFEGDISFQINKDEWKEVSRNDFGVDEKHNYCFSILELVRK